MSRYAVIALEQLPLMEVLETLDAETILSARMSKLVEYWSAGDPPSAANYDVDMLEFDPLRINQEASTYSELMIRDRINQAARAVTTAYSSGGDLDAIGSRYPGGVPRLAVVSSPRDFDSYPEDWESDARYRRRIWLSVAFLSPHGVFEAYVFWALTSDVTLRDATATSIRGTGRIYVTIMAGGTSPTPTVAQLSATKAYIEDESRKGLTDEIYLQPPKITPTQYRVRVWLLPGFDQDAVMETLETSVAALIEEQRWLGFDHTLMALNAALKQTGVYNVVIDSPTADVIVAADGLVNVTSVTLTYAGRGE